jgi:hypothetical protein
VPTINCTFGLNGEPLAEAGPIDWAFNCDMVTPFVTRGKSFYNVDLSLDVMVAPDGLAYSLTDEDDFTGNKAAGLLTPTEIIGARQGANERSLFIGHSWSLTALRSQPRRHGRYASPPHPGRPRP